MSENQTSPQHPTRMEGNEGEALYLVDDTVYLHVQPTDEGWDYSLYDKATRNLIDGGVLEPADVEASPVSSLAGAVRTEVFALQGMTPTKVVYEDLAVLDALLAVDTYEIYQLKNKDSTALLRFESYALLQKQGLAPDPDNYVLVYSGPMRGNGSQLDCLEDLYYKFNMERPEDFTGHSLSVSDIIALNHSGVVSYHYCDSIGFRELPHFRKPENHLKNVEISMEDDYGMIDGIINNGKAANREASEKKPSVVEQLKSHSPKSVQLPKKFKERER